MRDQFESPLIQRYASKEMTPAQNPSDVKKGEEKEKGKKH